MSEETAQIRIIGKTHTIAMEAPSKLGANNWGLYSGAENTIYIRSGLMPEDHADTVLHECIHAIDYTMQAELTERQVHVVAAGVCALINDNREYFRTLFGF